MSELRHAIVHLTAIWGDMWVWSMGRTDEEAIAFAIEKAPGVYGNDGSFRWAAHQTQHGVNSVHGIVTWWGPPYEGGAHGAQRLNEMFQADLQKGKRR